jgi:uncharacterized protein (UPF0333 family)
MKTKIIAGIVIIVLIIAVAFVTISQVKSASQPTPTSQPTPSTDATTAAISSVVGEQYSNLIQDQLNNMSIDQPDFNNQTQNSMASDFSQFYFT